MGISKSSWCTKRVRGTKGHETSKWVQLKASFKCKVSYGAGWRQSWKDGNGDEERRVVAAEQTQGAEIIASIDEVTLGGFQRDWESQWATGSWSCASSAFCASSRHIPIIHGYLYSRPNWKVGLWTICMHPHSNCPFSTHAYSHMQTHSSRHAVGSDPQKKGAWRAAPVRTDIPRGQTCKAWLKEKPCLSKVRVCFHFLQVSGFVII